MHGCTIFIAYYAAFAVADGLPRAADHADVELMRVPPTVVCFEELFLGGADVLTKYKDDVANPFPTSSETDARLGAIFTRWRESTEQVSQLRCDISRWDYDTDFDKKSVSSGTLWWSRDGRWHLRLTRDGEPILEWLCSGQFVYEYHHERHNVWRYRLPEIEGLVVMPSKEVLMILAPDALRHRVWTTIKDSKKRRPGETWITWQPRSSIINRHVQHGTIILKEGSNGTIGTATEVYYPGGKLRVVTAFDAMEFDKDAAMPERTATMLESPVPKGWSVQSVELPYFQSLMNQAREAVNAEP